MRKPVISALECEDAGSAGDQKSGLDRGFHGVCSAQAQHHPRLWKGRERGEFVEQRNLHVRRMNIAKRVKKPLRLHGNSLHDRWVPVPCERDTEPRCQVDEDIAVDVPHVGAAGLAPDDRVMRCAGAFRPPRPPRRQGGTLGAGKNLDQLRRPRPGKIRAELRKLFSERRHRGWPDAGSPFGQVRGGQPLLFLAQNKPCSGYPFSTPVPGDASLHAFRRLLADAHKGGPSKVDALVALSQRTVFVSTWSDAEDAYRVMTSSSGVRALAVYSSHDLLDSAARRLGWTRPDGTVFGREIGARAAFSYARTHDLLIIVDMHEPHALEIDRSEIEPLLQPHARRDTAGPFAAAGRVSSSLMQAVNASPRSGSPPRTLPELDVHARQTMPPPPGASVPADEARGGTVRIAKLATAFTEELLDWFTRMLRSYPEVEWGCMALLSRGNNVAAPGLVIRIDPAFRTRAQEVVTALERVAEQRGATVEVLLADDPDTVRSARTLGTPFYPWRRSV